MKKTTLLFLLVLITGLIFGCATTGEDQDTSSSDIPQWLTELPQKEGFLYAVGVSSPQMSPSTALAQAKAAGIENLSWALSDMGYNAEELQGVVMEDSYMENSSKSYVLSVLLVFDMSNLME